MTKSKTNRAATGTQKKNDAHSGYLAYKAKYFPDVAAGTFEAQRCLARWEADRLLKSAKSAPIPDLNRLYLSIQHAVDEALSIVKLSRSKSPVSPEAVVGSFVRLAEFNDRASAFTDNPKLLSRWPKSPGFTLGLTAGWSVLDTGYRFARSIHRGSQIGGQIGAKAFARVINKASLSPPDPLVRNWAAGVIKEITEMTLPPEHFWPVMGLIHRDGDAFQLRLLDEYECAVEAQSKPRRKVVTESMRGGGGDSELRDELNRLDKMQRKCIELLFERRVTSLDSPGLPSQELLARLLDRTWNTNFKQSMSALVKTGFLDNDKHHGGRGGYCLSTKGVRAAQFLNSLQS